MPNEEEISVSMDEIPEEFEKFKKTEKEFYDLVSTLYNYSTWATNISIALLGFFIAVLLQLKSADAIFGIIHIIIVLVILTGSISIGFFLKIRYEIIATYNSLNNSIRSMLNFMKIVNNKFVEKGVEMESLNETIDQILKTEIIKKPKVDSILKKMPIKLVFFQFALVFTAVLYVASYFITYIFFK